MKRLICLLLICAFTCKAEAQFQRQIENMEKYISINDRRALGYWLRDTSTVGRSIGDVSVDRMVPFRPEQKDSPPDSTSSYPIHFYKMYGNALTCYSMMHDGKENFDKASYRWLNDTVVKVTLYEKFTGEKTTYKLTYDKTKCCSAGLLFN